MKKATNTRLLAIIFIFFFFTILQAHSQSQAQMNTEVQSKYIKANKKLNIVYQQILKDYAKQPIFIKNFKAAEVLWLRLRDAELAARYPGDGQFGSAEPMCRIIYLTNLTQDRIIHLTTWIDGIPEGDVCNGSVKMKP